MIRDRLTCRRGRTAALGAALLCMAAACHGDSTAPPASEGGTYTLVSVNGQALPASISNTAVGTVVIQSATLDLVPGSSSSTYTAVVTGTEGGSQASQAIISDAGTYVRSGSTITFTSSVASGLAYAGSLNGTSLAVGVPGQAIGASGTLSLVLHRS
ncbi:MAG TPA: hypothetical protein VJU87_08685 [Gemmatimonadaceae bacterium]|nr:hypothetical protein [Gemmatimonadaceae bacterium]